MNLAPLSKVATDIQIILGLELIALKRNASGSLINSFQHIITPSGEFGFDMKILGNSYWRVVEYGVSAENVPFDASTRSGAANSKYIDGLIAWIKIKGIASDNDVVRGIAFAIATKQTSTSRGGYGKGNPMDKSKLGFVRKSKEKVNFEIQKISKIYETEVVKILKNGLATNFEIII
jgi:hypothetical protein|tara:strand:- start:2626 stop:3156 length:531 start_codon:yes stop_codon:yes gene_type:complete